MAKFTEIFDDVTKYGRKIPTNEYLSEGKYPIIDQGQSMIAGYTDETDGLYEDVPAIIFGDHTRILKYVDTPCFLGADGVKLLKAKKENANYKYLYYALCNVNIPNTGYNRHFKWLKESEFDIPSCEEQKRIVDVLDKVSELIDLRKKQLSKLDELVKSRFVEMFGDPIYNEKGWNRKPLVDICKTIVDCPHSTPKYTSDNTGYMCIRTSIVKKNKILRDQIEYIPEDEFFQRIQRKKPEKGDVVYTREGAILGIAAIIDRDYDVALGQRMMLLSPNLNECSPYFLSVAMNFDSFLKNALKGLSGSASPHINVADIKAFEMIIPPIDLQNQFATFVEQTDKLKVEVKESLEKLETLKKALMQKYFG